MKTHALACCALLALALVLPTAQAAGSAVTDSSFRAADGTRVMELSAEVDAPLQAVWDDFTTAAGFMRWAAPFARVDLRVGGEYETSYAKDARAGLPANIRNRIEAVVPLRLVVIRNVQAPPVVAFDVPTFQRTQTAVHFQPLGPQRTRVTLHNAGYGDDPEAERTWQHFLRGNRWTLDKLVELHAPQSPPSTAAGASAAAR